MVSWKPSWWLFQHHLDGWDLCSTETHRRFCFRKKGERPTPIAPPKTPCESPCVGRNQQGECNWYPGIMNAEGYVTLLENALLPFLQLKFADKDPKHVSRRAQAFLEEHHINWWHTPPESPDLNPIENLWHELKEHIRAQVKPRNLNEHVNGIKDFWSTVSKEKCCKYISHLRKVIPRVIELEGNATGYWLVRHTHKY